MTHYDVVDLFAGPGGASLGITALGFTELGFEWDDAACATRAAAGLATVQGDVSEQDPADYIGTEGLWASPPCQGFSRAGLQKGHGDAQVILDHIAKCMDGWVPAEVEEWADPRSHLVLEPLRWAQIMRPRWMVWEQVPFVLTIWEACKPVLEAAGYHVWTGKLHSEQYGVPQTRERAILIASLDGPVDKPTPTHSRYYSRSPEKLDEGVEKWMSMAEALGWGMSERPSVTLVTGGGRVTSQGGNRVPLDGGSGARKRIKTEREEGLWVEKVGFPRRADTPDEGVINIDGVDYRSRDLRDSDEPAFTVTEKARSWNRYVVSTGNNSSTIGPGKERKSKSWRETSTPWERSIDVPAPTLDTKVGTAWRVHEPGGREVRVQLRNNTSAKAAVRAEDQPAPTMYFGARLNSMHWELVNGATSNATVRPADAPAPTLLASMDNNCTKWRPQGMLTAGLNNTAQQRERSPDEPSATLTGKATAYWVLTDVERTVEVAVWFDEDPELTQAAWVNREVDGLPGLRGVPVENMAWPLQRPSTVIAGRGLAPHPGRNTDAVERAAGKVKSRNDGIRVSVEEAGVLQSFPAGYPWAGFRLAPHVAEGRTVEDDRAIAHELVGDGLQRGVHFVVSGLVGKHDEVLQGVVVPLTVDVMYDLVRLRPGDHAMLRYEGASSEDVTPVDTELRCALSALVRVERITVQAPLLPVLGAEAARDGFAFAVEARLLHTDPSSSGPGLPKSLVVHEADASSRMLPVATFDLAVAHEPTRYQSTINTKTKQFEQVGNAVPPLLALHAVTEAARHTQRSTSGMPTSRRRSSAAASKPLIIGIGGHGDLDAKAITANLDAEVEGREVTAVVLPLTDALFTDAVDAAMAWAQAKDIAVWVVSSDEDLKKDKGLADIAKEADDDFDAGDDPMDAVIELLKGSEGSEPLLVMFMATDDEDDITTFELADENDIVSKDICNGMERITFGDDDAGEPDPEPQPPAEEPKKSRRAKAAAPSTPATDGDIPTVEALKKWTATELKKKAKQVDPSLTDEDLKGTDKDYLADLIVTTLTNQAAESGSAASEGASEAEDAPAPSRRRGRATGSLHAVPPVKDEAPAAADDEPGDLQDETRDAVFARLRGQRETAEAVGRSLARSLRAITEETSEENRLEAVAGALAAGLMVFAEHIIIEVRKPKSAGRPRNDGTEAQPKEPTDPEAPKRGRGRPRRAAAE